FWIPHGDPPNRDDTLPPVWQAPGRRSLHQSHAGASRRALLKSSGGRPQARAPVPAVAIRAEASRQVWPRIAPSMGDYPKSLNDCNARRRGMDGKVCRRVAAKRVTAIRTVVGVAGCEDAAPEIAMGTSMAATHPGRRTSGLRDGALPGSRPCHEIG